MWSPRTDLKLHVRVHGPRLAPGIPVVCLPGLARTAEDFDDLAHALGGNPEAPRRVYALDYRGRGSPTTTATRRTTASPSSSATC